MADVTTINLPSTSVSSSFDDIRPSNFGKLKRRIQVNASKLKAPVLSGNRGDMLEFDSSTINSSSSFKILETLSKKRPLIRGKVTANQPLTLQNWKAQIEKKMKVRREEEMDKRQELYRLEQEQVNGEVVGEESESELETDSEDSSDEEQNDGPSEEDVEKDGPDLQNQLQMSPKVSNSRTEVEILASSSQESQMNLHLYLETDEPGAQLTSISDSDLYDAKSSQKYNVIPHPSSLEELNMDKNIPTQQAREEAVMLLTNPFSKAEDQQESQKNASQSDIFPSLSQSQSSLVIENNSNNLFLKSDVAAGLKMEKHLTSQEAEKEVLDLLTNPFQKDSCSTSLAESLTRKPVPIANSSQYDTIVKKRKRFALMDDEEENAMDGFDFVQNKMKFKKLFVSDDEESTIQLGHGTESSSINVKNEKSVREMTTTGIDCNQKQMADTAQNVEVEESNGSVLEEQTDDESTKSTSVEILDNEDGNFDEDEEEKLARELRQSRFVDKRTKLIRREFVEHEAELSGSDVDSDEDDEVPSDEDELEIEEGDLEDLPSDDELRAQVGKIHHKQMLDDDKRRLLMYKDAYLPDGEMHSETDVLRRFRWRKADEEDITMENKALETEDDDIQIIEEEGMESWREIQKERAQFLLEKGLKSEEFEENSINADADTCKLFRLNRINIRKSISSYSSTSFASAVGLESKTLVTTFPDEGYKEVGRESFLRRQQSVLNRIVNENSNSALSNSAPLKSLFVSEKSSSVDDSVQFSTVRRGNGQKVRSSRESGALIDPKTDFKQDSVFSLF